MSIDEKKAYLAAFKRTRSRITAEHDVASANLRRCDGKIRDLESEIFIAENGITIGSVLFLDSPGMPFFGHVHKLCEWLKQSPPGKKYAEWNGRLHEVSKLIDGKFEPTPGLIEHLSKEDES